MRLHCNRCGKSVSTEVPESTVVRAWLECPECVERTHSHGRYIGVVGSRRRNEGSDLHKVKEAFLGIYQKGDYLVSGGCPKGADNFAEKIARAWGKPILIFHANWTGLGTRAGFVRNTYIAEAADILIACPSEDRSGGTEDTIKKFLKAKPQNQVILV